MLKEGSRLYSILYNKCPRCNKGPFFDYSNPYNLKTFDKKGKACGVCGQSYEPEPGYYYGAMYVSYGLNVMWFVAGWIATSLLLPKDINIWWTGGIMIGLNLLLVPVTFRLARIIWINLFIHYDASAKEKH